MLDLKVSFWNNNNPLCTVADQLQALLPSEGEVEQPRKNRALEKFRRAVNCYSDLYNNGLCNRVSEFREVFGLASTKYKHGFGRTKRFSNELYIDVEALMEQIVVKACEEQRIAIAVEA